MPLGRYFLYVGGVLLTLVFILDACLTSKLPVIERSHANSPVIRIHSDRKWPERIVFDTTLPTIVSAPVIVEDLTPNPATATDVSVKVREREAFALMQPSDAKRLEPSEPKNARTEGATTTQNREAARCAAIGPGSAAAAVWLVW